MVDATSEVTAAQALSNRTRYHCDDIHLADISAPYRPVPVIPILGARKVSQLRDNLASFELDLSAEQVKSLDAASGIEPGFPFYRYEAQMTRALAYGGMRDRIIA